jgi:hypothetical protein
MNHSNSQELFLMLWEKGASLTFSLEVVVRPGVGQEGIFSSATSTPGWGLTVVYCSPQVLGLS